MSRRRDGHRVDPALGRGARRLAGGVQRRLGAGRPPAQPAGRRRDARPRRLLVRAARRRAGPRRDRRERVVGRPRAGAGAGSTSPASTPSAGCTSSRSGTRPTARVCATPATSVRWSPRSSTPCPARWPGSTPPRAPPSTCRSPARAAASGTRWAGVGPVVAAGWPVPVTRVRLTGPVDDAWRLYAAYPGVTLAATGDDVGRRGQPGPGDHRLTGRLAGDALGDRRVCRATVHRQR